MTNTATEVLSVVIEREIPYPPEKIWRALTQPHLIEEWLMKNDFKPAVGHRFNLRGGWGCVLDCEVLAVEPNRTLSYTWNFAHDDAAYNLKSVVNFTLTPTSTGTHLRVEQSGFRPDQKQVFGGAKAGRQQFFAKLEQVLARADWHTSKPGTLYRVAQRGHLWVNAMANKTSIKSTKVAKKAAAKRVAAKTAKPRKTARELQSRKVARPALLAGGNPQIAKTDGDAPRAGLHRGHAGLETGRWAPPRRAHRAHRPRRAQGREVELAAVRDRGPGLVPRHPLLHELRQGGFLPRHVAASCRPNRPSKHLGVLRRAGLVRNRHEGRQTHYSAQLGALAPLIDWTSHMAGFWQSRSTSSKTC